MALHVVPTDEDHTLTPACRCGPDVDQVRRDDGSHGWLIWHWPTLDDHEPDGTDSSTP